VSDRLEEFRRQRDVLRRHLDWLDREIADLVGSPAEPPPASAPYPPEAAPYPPASQAAPTAPGARVSDLDAEAILAEYRRPPADLQRQTRLGCFIYFGVALAILALVVAAVYILSRRAHGH
jgi:hypothetical protein